MSIELKFRKGEERQKNAGKVRRSEMRQNGRDDMKENSEGLEKKT